MENKQELSLEWLEVADGKDGEQITKSNESNEQINAVLTFTNTLLNIGIYKMNKTQL